ncbi:ribonuclease P 40kDa subunit-domain-containing protein [Hysterangium stoloniferum]|nr:ribonuclease P 40kDa subunit-domain-containing protein [Hysterangium stoloniferum]
MFIHQGVLPEDQEVLTTFINNRPFVHQLDVILANSEEAADLVLPLTTSYFKIKVTFSTIFEIFTSRYRSPAVIHMITRSECAPLLSTTTTALTVGDFETEDVWCLDSRGILSLLLTSSTHERLGISGGTRIAALGHKISFLIKLDLRDTSSSLAMRSRECLTQWDSRREDAGEGLWEVLLSTDSSFTAADLGTKVTVNPEYHTISHAHIPPSVLPFIKSDKPDNAEATAELFEWLGLACLGSQCLDINGAVNSYTASYDPPQGSTIGTIYHIRWLGFLSPAFVSLVVNEILSRSEGIRGISVLTFDALLSRTSSVGGTNQGEDAWSLIAAEGTHAPQDRTIHWLLAERNSFRTSMQVK